MYEDIIEKLNNECEIRNLSPRTSFMYEFHTKKFLEWINDKPLSELTLIDVRNYILERKRNGACAGYCNSMCSALSFFYRHILHIPWDLDIIPRMKVDWNLPKTLSREEIEKLIDTAHNIRNKAIIALIYSSGLRAGEVTRLSPEDIYMSSMQVHVRNSKNRGDHWTVLSERTLELLKQYWHAYPQPRDVLIENNTSREFVQTMLGHRSSSSTEVYIHVSNKSIMGVKSPLDIPQKEEG